MDQEFFEQFNKIRKLVNKGIEHYLKEDCGHKSYEGAWDVTLGYPNYFEDDTGEAPPCYCKIELHCYVIGLVATMNGQETLPSRLFAVLKQMSANGCVRRWSCEVSDFQYDWLGGRFDRRFCCQALEEKEARDYLR